MRRSIAAWRSDTALPSGKALRLGAMLLAGAALLSGAGLPTAIQARDIPSARADQPETASGFELREPVRVRGRGAMAVTANVHASRAAARMLSAGGSAVDAAIAAQMVLTLVEPQSSGIGGGAFLLHFDAKHRRVSAWDGRETAPAKADETLLLDASGKPLGFFEAVVGGRSVGVPGVLRTLEAVHREHGVLPWPRLFEPAIALARGGFEVSPRLHTLLSRETALREDPEASELFYDANGNARPVGHLLKNPRLGDTFEQIARRGSLALHAGPIAREIADRVRNHPLNPGLLGEHDLAFYEPVEREPLCVPHLRFRICGMPPPAGGLPVAQMLKLWRIGAHAHSPLRLASKTGGLDPNGAHRFAEIGRLVFADRDRYLADPEFAAIPGGPAALLDDSYLARRAALVGDRALPGPVSPGQIAGAAAQPAHSFEQTATTHVSIVDSRGNAVAMTSSIESAFGARIMVRGFLLNNQLTDFSFAPTRDGAAVANRVQPGKRPRSAMAPTLVLDRSGGELELVIGSPGGPSIIHYVARSLISILDDGIDAQAAVSMPNLGNRNGPTELERGRAPRALAEALRARGHEIREVDMTSGLHAIALDCPPPPRHHRQCTLTGAVDPRREGSAIGVTPAHAARAANGRATAPTARDREWKDAR